MIKGLAGLSACAAVFSVRQVMLSSKLVLLSGPQDSNDPVIQEKDLLVVPLS